MKISIHDEQLGRFIEAEITKGGFRDAEEYLKSLVHDRMSNGAQLNGGEQVRNFKEFCREMASLPIESPDDGFSGANHDDVLYRRDL